MRTSRSRKREAKSKKPEAGSQTIRVAKARDVDALAALERRCFPKPDVFPRRTWARLARVPTALTLAIDDGHGGLAAAIVGLFRAGSIVARVYSIAVDPAQRGRGLAGSLVRELARRARRRGCLVISLEVRERNRAALGLYEKLGFRVVGKLSRYYADGGHGLRLRARIAGLASR
jgi:ribosomal protein S18 acetylase RimI-like enzyme